MSARISRMIGSRVIHHVQSSRIHSPFFTHSLTKVLRLNTMVDTIRHTDTARTSHFNRDSGLMKFDVCPEGGGKADVGWAGAAMVLREDQQIVDDTDQVHVWSRD